MTMYFRFSNSLIHFVWCGRMPAVEHVRVGQDDVALGPDGPPGVLRRVPVVGEDADLGGEELGDLVELGPLVLGQGLGREEVDGPARGVADDGVEDGEVVAKRLARGRGRDDRDVPALPQGLPGAPLVGVQGRDTLSP